MSDCPKCRGALEPGFIPDASYGAILRLQWTEGQPEKSFWGNTKTRGRRQIAITADRCTKCGYLELYARP